MMERRRTAIPLQVTGVTATQQTVNRRRTATVNHRLPGAPNPESVRDAFNRSAWIQLVTSTEGLQVNCWYLGILGVVVPLQLYEFIVYRSEDG